MVFWTYDIRGLYEKELTPEFMHKVGKALTFLGVKEIVVGTDGRFHSPELKKGLLSGLAEKSPKILDAELVPTPSITYVSFSRKIYSAAITASHNPIEWNGCKIVNEGLAVPSIFYQKIREFVLNDDENVEIRDVATQKIDAIQEHFKGIRKNLNPNLDGIRVVMDFRGGIGSKWKEQFQNLGIEAIGINDRVDPFLTKDPEPKIENMEEAKRTVEKWHADAGFVFDGDADRVLVIDDEGNAVPGDVLLALLCEDYKKIVTIYEASMLFEELGYEVIRTRRGDVFYCKAMKDKNFPMAGEDNGHICFSEFQIYPDPAYTVVKLLVKLKKKGMLSDLVKEYPKYEKTIRSFKCYERDRILEEFKKKYPKHMDIGDGIKIFFDDAWVVVRKSQTEPKIRITVEAKSKERMNQLLKEFKVVC